MSLPRDSNISTNHLYRQSMCNDVTLPDTSVDPIFLSKSRFISCCESILMAFGIKVNKNTKILQNLITLLFKCYTYCIGWHLDVQVCLALYTLTSVGNQRHGPLFLTYGVL